MSTGDSLLPHNTGPEGTPIHKEICRGLGYVANMTLGLVQASVQGTRDLLDPAVSIIRRSREQP